MVATEAERVSFFSEVVSAGILKLFEWDAEDLHGRGHGRLSKVPLCFRAAAAEIVDSSVARAAAAKTAAMERWTCLPPLLVSAVFSPTLACGVFSPSLTRCLLPCCSCLV